MGLVRNELEQLEEERETIARQTLFQWGDFLKKKYLYRPLVVTIVIQMSQQFSGINAVSFYGVLIICCIVLKSYISLHLKVIFYSTSIFKNAGFKDQWPVYCTILLGVVQVIMTFICVIIVDKVGRRILLLIGMLGMCLSAFGLASFSILANKVRFFDP